MCLWFGLSGLSFGPKCPESDSEFFKSSGLKAGSSQGSIELQKRSGLSTLATEG